MNIAWWHRLSAPTASNAHFGCGKGPGLITNYKHGTPTDYGKGYKAHLLSLR